MKKRLFFIRVLLLLIILLSGALFYFFQKTSETFQRRNFPVMSTTASITVYDASAADMERALNAAQNKIYEVEKLCNIFDLSSELSCLNRDAFERDIPCSPLLWQVLLEADHFYEISGGAFDVTVKPLMQLWGFHRKRASLPSKEEIAKIKKTIGWKYIRLNHEKKSVRFLVKGIGIDLGGIAKGFAIDQAISALQKTGITRAVVNLGGNIRCILPPGKRPFRIGIRDPLHPDKVLETLKLSNQSVATSGNYERYVIINGKQYTHIMDPRTCKPVSGMLSVTVVTPRGVDSDALSTSVFIKGTGFADKICRSFPDTGILIIRRSGEKIIMQRSGTLKK